MGAQESVEGCKDPRSVKDGSHGSSPSRFLRILQMDFQVATQLILPQAVCRLPLPSHPQ